MAEGTGKGSLRGAVLVTAGVAAAGALLLVVRRESGVLPAPVARSSASAPAPVARFEDAFEGALEGARWAPTSEADFEEKVVDIQSGRLRLRCATRGTDDRTVKFFGVRSVSPIRLEAGTLVAAELDWNNQANGSYLSAGLVLAPARVEGNPLTTPDFLRVEYIGVPPGKNGRIVVVTRNKGREQYLFTEGWPQVRREGRPIGLQKVELRFRKGGAFEVLENGNTLFESKDKALESDTVYLYLQMSSHSNYPPRELFFDNVRVAAIP